MLRSSSVSAPRRPYHFWLVAAPLWLLGWQPVVVVVATPWINRNAGIRDTCRDHSFPRSSRDRLAFVSTATTLSETDKWESTWPVSSQVLFQPSSPAWNNNNKKCTNYLQSMRLHGTPSKDSEDDDDRESNGAGPLPGFNPWNPTSSSSASSSANLYQRAVQSSQQGTPRISIRQTQMQQVLSELLQAQSSSSATLESSRLQSILELHASFLLAPFTSTTFLDDDPNSIYTLCTTMAERYKCFQTTMKQRIQEARNPAVRTVLQALLEFVVDRVDDSPQDS